MSQVINTNLASLTARRNADRSENQLATTVARLSSGLRINSAKDDAAGLAISERFTAQIRGLNQAARNANDGISLAQTTEGGLASITDSLQRVRELAVQSANGNNSSTDRAALQTEVSALTAEIQRVATQAEFNGNKLLNGTFTAQSFQVGANAGNVIGVASLVDARATSLGAHGLTAAGTITGQIVTTGAGAINNGISAVTSGTGFTVSTAEGGTSGTISYAANAGADAIAAAINSAAGSTGITATATNSATLSNVNHTGNLRFVVNGSTIFANITNTGDLTTLVSSFNTVENATGVHAAFTAGAGTASITLTTSDGRNIKLEDFDNNAVSSDSYDFDGVTMTDGSVKASAVKTGTLTLTTTKGAITTANASAQVFALAGVNQSVVTSTVAAIDVSTVAGSNSALTVVDAALSLVNSSRAQMGALQNRFSSTIANLQTGAENLTASRSRIQDADFATETANLSRAQVLQQAGTAMVAQANQLPQQVLSLLR